MSKIFAFTGPSNSGKTRLICALLEHFAAQNIKCAAIKHDPGSKAFFDTPKKDSYLFKERACAVGVLSPRQGTIFSSFKQDENQRIWTILKAIKMLNAPDLILVEGLKSLPLPRMAVFYRDFDESYLPYAKAVAKCEGLGINKLKAQIQLPVFNCEDIEAIADFVLNEAEGLS